MVREQVADELTRKTINLIREYRNKFDFNVLISYIDRLNIPSLTYNIRNISMK